MTDLLLDVPESTPKWRELAERHGIESRFTNDLDGREFFTAEWTSEDVDSFGESRFRSETGETEREAVITLIHRLKLDGWQEVSL